MQSKGIDKQHKAESLAVVKHLVVYLQMQTTHEYAKEEHKGNTGDMPPSLILPSHRPIPQIRATMMMA